MTAEGNGSNLVARIQALAKDATTSGTNLDAAIRNLASAQCEVATILEQLRHRVLACEVSGGRVTDMSRGLEVERAAQEARRMALADRMDALESSSNDLSAKHAKVLQAHEAIHTDMYGQLRAHEERHAKVAQRLSNMEGACTEAIQQLKLSNARFEERHGAQEKDHLTLQQREYLEKSLGDSLSVHQKELQQSRQSVQDLAGHIMSIKSAHESHRGSIEELRNSMSQHQGALAMRSSSIEERMRALEAQAMANGKADRFKELEQRMGDVVKQVDRRVQEMSAEMAQAQQRASESTQRLDQHIRELSAARHQLEQARSPSHLHWQPSQQSAPAQQKRSLDPPHTRSEPTLPTAAAAGAGSGGVGTSSNGDKDFFRNVSALIVSSERADHDQGQVTCQWSERMFSRNRITAGTGGAPVGQTCWEDFTLKGAFDQSILIPA
eukprot:CAMPEP_0178388646 /NCGR_PEP_ID=MMETSP0689_2-20121128/9703_1 /TAXON_ID=160604 /ORGANISM="Amphidinium massartii, Strain CS-259" /LENGTH=438 /DNA_ID=CAMNT_0020009061 /DNA_START=84 /DNA_END=1401 /DNA_ORIENTATION=-